MVPLTLPFAFHRAVTLLTPTSLTSKFGLFKLGTIGSVKVATLTVYADTIPFTFSPRTLNARVQLDGVAEDTASAVVVTSTNVTPLDVKSAEVANCTR